MAGRRVRSPRRGGDGKIATYFGNHHGGVKVGWFEEETGRLATELEDWLLERFKLDHGEYPLFNERRARRSSVALGGRAPVAGAAFAVHPSRMFSPGFVNTQLPLLIHLPQVT
jgi:hypothetical protein